MRYAGLMILMMLPGLLPAQQKDQSGMIVHEHPADHLTISIPAGWTEISKAELDQMSATIRKTFPEAKPQSYNYGFQEFAEAEYPRVLVQVKETGRLPEKVFEDVPKSSSPTQEIEERVNANGPEFAALKIRVGEFLYEPERRILWMRAQFTGPDGETMATISSVHPTEIGSIQVHCYASSDAFESYLPLFSKIISSVQIEEGWQYRERSTLERVLGGLVDPTDAVIGGIAGLMAALILRRRRTGGRKAQRPTD